MGCKIGGEIFLKELTRSRANIEIDRTKTEIDHLVDIERGD